MSNGVKLQEGGNKGAAHCISKLSLPMTSPCSTPRALRVAVPSTSDSPSANGLRFKSTGVRRLARGWVTHTTGEQSASTSIGEDEAPTVIGAAEVGGWRDGGDRRAVIMLVLLLFLTRRLRS